MIDNTMGSNNNSGAGNDESNSHLPQIAVDLSTKVEKMGDSSQQDKARLNALIAEGPNNHVGTLHEMEMEFEK